MNDHRPYIRRAATSGVFNAVVSAAAVAVLLPLIISRIGLDAYGFWAMLNVFVGIACLLDLGVSKALTYMVPVRGASASSELLSAGVLICGAATACALG